MLIVVYSLNFLLLFFFFIKRNELTSQICLYLKFHFKIERMRRLFKKKKIERMRHIIAELSAKKVSKED